MSYDYESKLSCILKSSYDRNRGYSNVSSELVKVPNTNEISWSLKAHPTEGLHLIVNAKNEAQARDLSFSILITTESPFYTHNSEFIALKCTTANLTLGTFLSATGSHHSFSSIFQSSSYDVVINATLRARISTVILADEPHSILADIRNEDLTDFTIQIDSKSWKAHKSILAARSSVFRSMLANKDCDEYKQSLLKIVDVSVDIFELFFEFLYTDRLPNLSLKQATEVLIVADKYDVKKLKTMCDIMLVKILKATDPVYDVFQLAHALNCSDELKKKAFDFVNSTIYKMEALHAELVDEPAKVKTLVDKLKDFESALMEINQEMNKPKKLKHSE